MDYFELYLKKINEEVNLAPNQIEIVGNNVYGTLGGKDIGKLKANEFYELIKTKMPSLYQAIEAKGGIEALRGEDNKADITIHNDGKITINPDKRV
jgi:hypothetical protein